VYRRYWFFLLFCFAVPLRAEPSNPKFLEMENLLAENDLRGAERYVDEWMEQEKKSAWSLIAAGRLAYQNRQFKKGLSYLKQALAKAPQSATAYYWRGRIYEAMMKPVDAANEYRAALLATEPYTEAQPDLDRVLASLGISNDAQ
jgi:uncharacterized protein HemY